MSLEIQALNTLLFNLFMIPVIFFSILFYFFAITTLTTGKKPKVYRKPRNAEWPHVTVQIPVYNDPIAVRCINKCLAFDYPKNRYDIIVADDSTDKKTKGILDNFVKGKKNIQLVRRKNRKGYKPGALNKVLKITQGEYVVVFDSDFLPKKNFLKKVITPFLSNNDLAIVQTRMGYTNSKQNSITKFASLSMMIFYQIILPIYSKTKSVFFCGTHGAIKTSVLREVGGWNSGSLTEDADLSINILSAGYKTLYLSNVRVRGEVPFTLDNFIKQQTRWTYGQTRAIIENGRKIISNKNLIFRQRFVMLFSLSMYIILPFVILSAITGQLGWIINPPKPIEIVDMVNFSMTMFLTFGYGAMGAVALARENRVKDSAKILPLIFVLGLVLAATNLVAFLKAVTNRKMTWIKTPKFGSLYVLDLFRGLFRK